MKIIAVFNNKSRVGTTSLVYHLAWMYANLDYNVVVADLDPQANLSSMFLEDDELEKLWSDVEPVPSIPPCGHCWKEPETSRCRASPTRRPGSH